MRASEAPIICLNEYLIDDEEVLEYLILREMIHIKPRHAGRHHIPVVKRRADDVTGLHHDDLVLLNVAPTVAQ